MKRFPIPLKTTIVTGFNVVTRYGGIAKEFGLGEKATEENIAQVKRQALTWAEDNITTYGELYVVKTTREIVRLKRFFKELPENVHPMSTHLAHRNYRSNEFEIPSTEHKAQLA